MPSWIGPWEIAIVLVLALLIFGPRKLPDLGASLGKSIRGFKKGLKEGQDELTGAMAEVSEAVKATDAEPAQAAANASAEATSATTADAALAEPSKVVSAEPPASEPVTAAMVDPDPSADQADKAQ